MRKTLPLALATAFLMSSMSSATSADLIGGAGTGSYSSRHTKPLHHARPHREKAWQPPRNMHVVVSARYCENTACEPVTLRIWSGDTFIMHRLGPHEERIRIANIDAADVVARCPTEATVAQDAKLQLMSILSNSTFVLARVSGERDRTSTAFVTANGRDVGKSMMDRRHARPHEQPERRWC